MKITQRNLDRIISIQDLPKRKARLQDLCLSLGHHGGIWAAAMEELDRLNQAGIKTALQMQLERHLQFFQIW